MVSSQAKKKGYQPRFLDLESFFCKSKALHH